MQEEHKRAIQRNFSSLVDRTDLKAMASALFERGVFSRPMYDVYLNDNMTELERKRLLYRRITLRGPDAFGHLVDALMELGYWDLVREMDPNSPLQLQPRRRNPPSRTPPPDDSDENSYVSIKSENRKIKSSNACHSKSPSSLPPPAPGPPAVDPELSPITNGNDAIDLPITEIPNFHVKKSTSFFEEDKERGIKLYKTRGRNRGTLLLLTYCKFEYGIEGERRGAEIDTRNLKYLFSEMGFKVLAYENLKEKETLDMLASVKEVVAGSETVFTVVSSHGYERQGLPDTSIRCSDGGLISDTEVIEFFDHKKMPKLKGVPKVFIFQVCRGAREDYVVETDVLTDQEDGVWGAGDAEVQRRLRLRPQYSDTLVVHSTVPGTVSHRDPKQGSWYIQALCEVFAAHAHDCHVDKLFKKVDELLQRKFRIQTSSVDSRGFNKKLFLHPGLFE